MTGPPHPRGARSDQGAAHQPRSARRDAADERSRHPLHRAGRRRQFRCARRVLPGRLLDPVARDAAAEARALDRGPVRAFRGHQSLARDDAGGHRGRRRARDPHRLRRAALLPTSAPISAPTATSCPRTPRHRFRGRIGSATIVCMRRRRSATRRRAARCGRRACSRPISRANGRSTSWPTSLGLIVPRFAAAT